MKHLFATILASLVLLTACNQKQHEEELAAAKQRQDSLQAVIDTRDSQIDELFATLTQIEEAISSVSTKYGQIREMKTNDPEATYNIKDDITQQLNTLDQMLSDNKRKIAYLNEKLQVYGKEKGTIQEFVDKLEQRIEEQEQQIATLTSEIAQQKIVIDSLNQSVTDLTIANEEKANIIAEQIIEANKAYYIVATYDQLKQYGVLQKEGGILGMGRKQILSNNIPINLFACIDRFAVTDIPVNLKNAIVVSSHPTSSYTLVYSSNNRKVVHHLHITNPTAFWQTTNYLVISTK